MGFLSIPIGGRPAAMGGAYSALASDSYAPISNPAGLGFLPSSQFALMHLSYVESMSYDFASLVHPFSGGRSAGLAVQNLRPGKIQSTDINGDLTGDFSGSFLSASLGLGQSIGRMFSIGLVGKVIQSKIAGESANGYAGDIGVMVRPSKKIGVSAVAANIGPKITFLEEGDELPSAARLGGYYSPSQRWIFALQGTRTRVGSNSAQSGIEWNPNNFISIRGGYKTESTRTLSSSAGVTAGIGLHLAGQQFDYAWAPLGDLGDAQYFSMVFQWGQNKGTGPKIAREKEERTLILKEKKKKDTKGDIRLRQDDESFPANRGRGLRP